MLKFNKIYITYFALGIIFFALFAKFLLTLFYPSYLTPQETEQYYFSESLPLLISENPTDLTSYAKTQGHFLFSVPLVYLFPFAKTFGSGIFTLKIPQIFILGLISLLLFQILVKFIKGNKVELVFIALLISLSPWLTAIVYQNISVAISLLFFLLVADVFTTLSTEKINIKRFILLLIYMLGCALSSMTGFLFILGFIPIVLFVLFKKGLVSSQAKLKSTVLILIFTTVIAGAFFINKTYILSSLSRNTFIEKLRPSVLAEEINERQKVDYLSMNKNFILPGLIRKAIYNKPILAVNKLFSQITSLFDFEQWSFPQESYDQLKMSGILPKGNLLLLYFFEIPLIILGIFIIIQKQKYKPLLYLFIPALIPYIIFEKRDLIFSGVFLILFIFIAEIFSFSFVFTKFDNLKKPFKYLISVVVFILVTGSVINFYYLFFTKQLDYKRSDVYAFKETSTWLKENRKNHQEIIITEKFGPTHMMSAFYLDINPKEFWSAYLHPQTTPLGQKVQIQNMQFRPISWKAEQLNSSTIYIGFPGEFTKPAENLDGIEPPPHTEVLKEISLKDELVWQYGKKIWILKYDE